MNKERTMLGTTLQCVIILIVIIFNVAIASAIDNNVTATIAFDKTVLVAGETVNITFTLTNTSANSKTTLLIIALYDNTNKLSSIITREVIATANGTTVSPLSIILPNNVSGYNLKAFAFDNALKPLCNNGLVNNTELYYDNYVTFFNDDFADGNLTASPAWTNLLGYATTYTDSFGNISMKLNSTLNRYCAPALASVPTDGMLTMKYRVKIAGQGDGGIYIVNDSGAGYGFISEVTTTPNPANSLLQFKNTTDWGATSTIISSISSLTGSEANDWQTISILWDIDAKTFTFYLNGTQVGATITDATYTTFTKIVAYGKSLVYLDDIKINTTPKTVLHIMSWFTPIGQLGGRSVWGGKNQINYNYIDWKADSEKDYPIAPTGVEIPLTRPSLGSDTYYDLQYQAALKSELPMMKAAGYSNAVYDMTSDPIYDSTKPLSRDNAPLAHYKTYLKWIEAAEKVGGIKMGIFAEDVGTNNDYHGATATILSYNQWISLLKADLDNLPESNAVWKINNRPVLMTFGNKNKLTDIGTAPCFGWKGVIDTLRTTNSLYYIPDVNPTISNYRQYSDIADSAFSFVPASTTAWLTGSTTQTQQVSMLNIFKNQTGTSYKKIPFYLMSSRGYYRKPIGATTYVYAQADFERIHQLYMSAMNTNAVGVYSATWNDFEEETYIAPSARNGSALLDIYTYYNIWLRTGVKPSTDTENITISYPQNIPNTITTPSVTLGGATSPSFLKTTNPNTGRIFYWANVKTAQTLKINNLTSVSLPAGLSYGEIVDGIGAGAVTAQITVGGNTTTISDLKPVNSIEKEPDNGGLQFIYRRLK